MSSSTIPTSALIPAPTAEIYSNKHGSVPKPTSYNYHAWSQGVRYFIDADLAWDKVIGFQLWQFEKFTVVSVRLWIQTLNTS
ncbi:hypothetical protein BDZ91DRAFT_846079 [Kalaharituber pfeilii]|nr:hypothetical protein BDZ91DRAFT_846079 [Kalaharituber pfeilii]